MTALTNHDCENRAYSMKHLSQILNARKLF